MSINTLMQIKIFVKSLKIYWKTCKKMHQEKQTSRDLIELELRPWQTIIREQKLYLKLRVRSIGKIYKT